MKKSLVIISFAFIFLLTISVVSAGFFDWITGDVQTTGNKASPPTSVSRGDAEGTTSSKTSTSDVRSSTRARFGVAGACPGGWDTLSAKDGGGNCCRKAENKGRIRDGKLPFFGRRQ